MTIAAKEAGNQPKFSATSPVSSSVSSVKELFEISRLCQSYKRVSREDRKTRGGKGEILGLSFKNPLNRTLLQNYVTVCSPAVCST